MTQIDYPPVQQALKRIRRLSADEEAQHLAMMRERAVHTEVTELRGAREDGRAEGRGEGLAEGLQQGLKAGQERGLLEGKRALLIGLLGQRVGSLADHQRERIRSSGAEAIEGWSRQLFDAVSMKDLLGSH